MPSAVFVFLQAEFPGNVDRLRHASLTEVNQFVIAKYKQFKESDIGKGSACGWCRTLQLCWLQQQ
jgi:hypothetical protein